MPKNKNEGQEQEIDLEQLPGDMKLALKYPGVNPAGKKTEEEYTAYINGVKAEIQSKLKGDAPRPERIQIHFENFDSILSNMKVAAIKNSKDYRTEGKYEQLDKKVGKAVSTEAAYKALGKYMSATLEPFVDAAYGKEIEEQRKKEARVNELFAKEMEIDEKVTEITSKRQKINDKYKVIKDKEGEENEKERAELEKEKEELNRKEKELEKQRKYFEADRVFLVGQKLINYEDMILVNGMTVRQHLTRMGRDITVNIEDEKSRKDAVANFVGIALQNGYKVEAYVADEKTGKIPGKRIELIPEGAKMAEMRILPERTWEKFCNFFGVQTDRQKHNLNVIQYYSNLHETKNMLKMNYGKSLMPDPEADREELEMEYKISSVFSDVDRLYGTLLSQDARNQYALIGLGLASKKEQYGSDYLSHLTPEEFEMWERDKIDNVWNNNNCDEDELDDEDEPEDEYDNEEYEM